MPFERWSVGEDLFNSLDKEHDLLDRDLRPFAEESDHLQGLQLIASVDDAWGGFAARYMDRIRDEFSKTTIWVWGLEESRRVPKASDHRADLFLASVIFSPPHSICLSWMLNRHYLQVVLWTKQV